MVNHAYIHIPFCHSICSYCDFCKRLAKNQNIEKYLDFLSLEIDLYIEEKETLSTLYVGGGTPSLLNESQLQQFFKIINNKFNFTDEYEYTFECNPEDITEQFCELLEANNVNRLSIGIQTLNDEILMNMNRTHNSEIVKNAIVIASKYFENISVDFMFDLPNEQIEDIDNCLAYLTANNAIKHVSYYSLILEQNTVLHLQNYVVDEDISTEKYYYILNYLENNGFRQYEISNFSKPNFQSEHNKAYWLQRSYYGFGLGASGYFQNDYRYTNTASISKYYNYISSNTKPHRFVEQHDDEQYFEEKLMLNLRMREGINKKYVKKLNDNLQLVNDNVVIKRESQHISNEIIVDLMLEQERND